MQAVQVRKARSGDLEAVLNLWQEMMDFHAGLDERLQTAPGARASFRPTLAEWMGEPERRVLVAVAEGKIVGYTIGVIAENPPIFAPRRYGHVSDIWVDPQWRRHGLGHRLFARLRTWFRQQGITVVQLHVAARNPVAQAFWRDIGFDDFLERLRLEI